MKTNTSTLKVSKQVANRFPRTRIEAFSVTLKKEKEARELQEDLAESKASDVEIGHVTAEEASQKERISEQEVNDAFNC